MILQTLLLVSVSSSLRREPVRDGSLTLTQTSYKAIVTSSTPLLITVKNNSKETIRYVVHVAAKEGGSFQDMTSDALQLSWDERSVTHAVSPGDWLTHVLVPRVFVNNWALRSGWSYRIRLYKLQANQAVLCGETQPFAYRGK